MGDIEVDKIDVDPHGGVTIRGRITDPKLVAALTRGSLKDVSVEYEAAHDPEGNGIYVRGVGWYSTTDFNRYFRVTRRG